MTIDASTPPTLRDPSIDAVAQSLHDVVTAVQDVIAAATPEREMLACGDVRLRFSEVRRRSAGLAGFLAERGLGARRERSRPSAQRTCSRTRAEGSSRRASRAASAAALTGPLPSATATLRSQRSWPMRRIALPSVLSRNTCSLQSNSSTRSASPS